jgi:hypothetical protein
MQFAAPGSDPTGEENHSVSERLEALIKSEAAKTRRVIQEFRSEFEDFREKTVAELALIKRKISSIGGSMLSPPEAAKLERGEPTGGEMPQALAAKNKRNGT